jgi:hypothetical protein
MSHGFIFGQTMIPCGFRTEKRSQHGIHFDAAYFRTNILSRIAEKRPAETAEDQRRYMVLHFDNTTPKTAQSTIDFMTQHRMRRAPHPTFSLDLAPSDFYLFGNVKTVLMDTTFNNEDVFLQGITEVLRNSPREQLEAAFENWLVR